MVSVKEIMGLQALLVNCPEKVRDGYYAMRDVIPVVDPDAAYGEYQPIHIKQAKNISDADAYEIADLYEDLPVVHYMFLRAYSLDLIAQNEFMNVIHGEWTQTPTFAVLADRLGDTLPLFDRLSARRFLLKCLPGLGVLADDDDLR